MAERRKVAIQESKFLGGDMEHTHLVKGLDYALLQKVRVSLLGCVHTRMHARTYTYTHTHTHTHTCKLTF